MKQRRTDEDRRKMKQVFCSQQKSTCSFIETKQRLKQTSTTSYYYQANHCFFFRIYITKRTEEPLPKTIFLTLPKTKEETCQTDQKYMHSKYYTIEIQMLIDTI